MCSAAEQLASILEEMGGRGHQPLEVLCPIKRATLDVTGAGTLLCLPGLRWRQHMFYPFQSRTYLTVLRAASRCNSVVATYVRTLLKFYRLSFFQPCDGWQRRATRCTWLTCANSTNLSVDTRTLERARSSFFSQFIVDPTIRPSGFSIALFFPLG